MGVGSCVEIEIVEVDAAIPPIRAPIGEPHALWNIGDDELRRRRYESYLELKKEFEPTT